MNAKFLPSDIWHKEKDKQTKETDLGGVSSSDKYTEARQ